MSRSALGGERRRHLSQCPIGWSSAFCVRTKRPTDSRHRAAATCILPATSPTVYHAGVDGKVGDNETPDGALGQHWLPDNAVEFWHLALLAAWNHALPHGSQPLTLNQLLPLVAEANKTDYIDDVSRPGANPPEDDIRTTARSRQFRGHNTNVQNGHADLDFLSAYGMVMGIRDANTHEWSFYIQENAIVAYYKKGEPALYHRSIPLSVRKFYPRPQGQQDAYVHQAFDAALDPATAFTVDPQGLAITR